MKTQKMMKKESLHVILTVIVFSFLSIQAVFASSETSKIRLKGEWINGNITERSIVSCPITAYTDGYNLYIQNTNPNCDITLTISNCSTNEILHEQTVPETETAYMVIPISNLSSGEYIVELTNQYGGSLYGYIKK